MTAYGRLDIFMPDGQFKTYTLDQPQITVGRSHTDIALDSEGISRYHFTLTYQDHQVRIVDTASQNGTYVDGVRLNTDESQFLFGGEEIQIGKLRILFTFFDDSPTRPVIVPEDPTRRIELDAPTYHIDLSGPYQAVAPGAHISAELTITHMGKHPTRYSVEAAGLPLEWVRIDRPDLVVAPDETALVIISFKPLRRSDSAPGDYPVTVNVRPFDEPTQVLQAMLTLRLLPFGGFGMALESTELDVDGLFRLHLHNQGSAPLPLSISKRDRDETLLLTLASESLVLQPGQRKLVEGKVRPARARLIGSPRQHSFDLLVRSGDAAGFVMATRAYLPEKPLLPTWAAYAVGGSALLAGLLVVAALLLLLARPVNPQIISFSVHDVRLTQGELLIVDWQTRDADQISISIDGATVFEGDPALGTVTLDTEPFVGDVTVLVEARRGDRTVSADEVVSIIQPMFIEVFTATPTRLYINVYTPLTVSWSVPGAATTSLSGLEAFVATSIQATPLRDLYGEQAALDSIVGYTTGALTLTLLAQDSDGNQLTDVVMIEAVESRCAPVGGAAQLYSGPGDGFQVIGTVPEASAVIVDAQDPTGLWLRVLVSGTEGWGRIDSFICDGFDPAALRKEFDIPTPVPLTTTPPPSATPAVLPTTTPRPTPTRRPLGG